MCAKFIHLSSASDVCLSSVWRKKRLSFFCRLGCPEASAPYVLSRIMQSCTHVISALSVPKNTRLVPACLLVEGFIAPSEPLVIS